jgi:hypothetical protein
MKRMMRSTLKTTVVILALLSPCGCLFTASAQGLTNTIPKNQAPLARTFLPTAAEQTPSGTGKFVIFTREETDKPNEWDFIAGAWECIPSRPEVPLRKRVEFCHSSWNAVPLLDTLVRDDSEGLFPRFVRLQVDAGNYDDCKVNLYDINYRTWEVRCLWQGNRLSAFGVMKNSVFCQDSNDWFRLDGASGAISRGVPFIPLDVDGTFWLVRKTGENSGVWSYDPAKELFVAHFGVVDKPKAGNTRSLLSADGRNRAWILVPMPNDWRGDVIGGTLLLQRDGHSDDVRVPVEMQAKAGSGVPVIPIGTRLCFTKDGMVEFSASQQKRAKKERVWTIDIASGKATESVRPYVEPKDEAPALFDGVPAPDYLRPYLTNLRHFGRGGLAPAFLMHLGILKKQPEFPDCTAGVSRDGRHILYKAKKGPLADVFIYGDLQTKKTVRWISPLGIKPGDSLEFVWVEAP